MQIPFTTESGDQIAKPLTFSSDMASSSVVRPALSSLILSARSFSNLLRTGRWVMYRVPSGRRFTCWERELVPLLWDVL